MPELSAGLPRIPDLRWESLSHRQALAELAVLDELGMASLVTTVPGLSAIGATLILAQTSDPTR